MRAKGVNKAQQLEYIFECRNSGLSDYQWCKEHDILPGTFYNWVSKLKKAGYQDIPDPVSRLEHKSVKQEIVKLDVTSEAVGEENFHNRLHFLLIPRSAHRWHLIVISYSIPVFRVVTSPSLNHLPF